MDFLFLIGFFVVWFVLNRWVLPKFGIYTCLSGSCRLPEREEKKNTSDGNKKGA